MVNLEYKKVIIVDDNNTFLEGMAFYMENILSMKVVGAFSDGQSFLDNKLKNEADIVMMDIEMPGLNGIETIKKFKWNHKDCRVLAITNYEDKAYLTELLGAGFKGCVFKKNIYDELIPAMNAVLSDKIYYPINIRIS